MADEKKPAGGKPEPAPAKSDPFVEVVWIILALLLFIYALNGIISFLSQNGFSGFRNFTPKGILLSSTKPISSLSNPIGSKFTTVKGKTDLFDSPGGKKISTKKVGQAGTIIGGPVDVDGKRYWKVRFDDGDEGWVLEDDIGAIGESGLSPLAKTVIFFWKLVSFLKILVGFLLFILLAFAVYLYKGIVNLRLEESKKLYITPTVESDIESENINPQWEKILSHIESTNENDWRQAIIEADIMLSDLLDKMSLPGETMGDKLKAVEKSDFLTIDSAWEAHKFRNNIAHEGMSFRLNDREARRIIDLYRTVFEEFHIVQKSLE